MDFHISTDSLIKLVCGLLTFVAGQIGLLFKRLGDTNKNLVTVTTAINELKTNGFEKTALNFVPLVLASFETK
jgi:hypothetical protein